MYSLTLGMAPRSAQSLRKLTASSQVCKIRAAQADKAKSECPAEAAVPTCAVQCFRE